MVNQRKEPTVSSVLTSSEDLSDSRSRARTRATPPQEPQVVVKKTSSFWGVLAFLLALAAAGVAGYAYWQLMQAQIVLDAQQARIAELENRLALSDDESSQSLLAVSAKVKESESEIRKLWGVAYDTNRKTINGNKKAIADAKKAISGYEKDLANLKKQQLAPLQKALKQQQTSVANTDKSISAVKGNVSEQGLLLQSLRERINEQNQSTKRVAAANQRIEKSVGNLKSLEKRIADHDEAIASFDAFRRTVNRDLLQLKQGTGAIQSSSP